MDPEIGCAQAAAPWRGEGGGTIDAVEMIAQGKGPVVSSRDLRGPGLVGFNSVDDEQVT